MTKIQVAAPARRAAAASAKQKAFKGFSDDEKAAARERVRELKAAARPGGADGESDLLAKIAEMQGNDHDLAQRLHSVLKAAAPSLSPTTWYGMPAYSKDGKVVCFFKPAQKFKARYATFEFNDKAHLDDGAMWPIGFALQKLTAVEEARIVALVQKALS